MGFESTDPSTNLNGAVEYDFDATGFGPQCDPNRKPSFDVRRPRLTKAKAPR